MALAICQICKYPVWSYICPDCLSREIGSWLPSRLSRSFRRFSRSFLEHFRSYENEASGVSCLKCRSKKEANVCSFCYITEVFSWLLERNRKLAKTLFMALPVDASARISQAADSWKQVMPISFEENGTDQVECEECGGFSEQATLMDGRWICSSCRDYLGQ